MNDERAIKRGRKFGKLTILYKMSFTKDGQVIYRCSCDCGGAQMTVTRIDLVDGNVTQCCKCIYESKVKDLLKNSVTELVKP